MRFPSLHFPIGKKSPFQAANLNTSFSKIIALGPPQPHPKTPFPPSPQNSLNFTTNSNATTPTHPPPQNPPPPHLPLRLLPPTPLLTVPKPPPPFLLPRPKTPPPNPAHPLPHRTPPRPRPPGPKSRHAVDTRYNGSVRTISHSKPHLQGPRRGGECGCS